MLDSPAALQQAKEQARARLTEAYAHDQLDQDTLDERLEAVERAPTLAALAPLTVGLAAPTTALVPVDTTPQRIGVLLGSVERHGAWSVATRTRVRVLFGSVVLDLRTATLPDGPLEIVVAVTFGSLEVIVPPGWQIDNRCGAVFASVEQDDSHRAEPGARVLRLTGRALFGSVAVYERLPGERPGDANRRRRRERRALARGRD